MVSPRPPVLTTGGTPEPPVVTTAHPYQVQPLRGLFYPTQSIGVPYLSAELEVRARAARKAELDLAVNYAKCFHCAELGHWQSDCPLLLQPADKAEHEARMKQAIDRFLEGEIGPIAKRRIIEKENALWKKKQKEMASK